MVEIIDDTATFAVTALVAEKARIMNVLAPTSVKVGVAFDVEYDVYNDGDVTGNIFGRMIDTSNETIIAGSDWTDDIANGVFKHVIHSFSDGITENLSVRIEAGHNE
jgi:hypothetical protein